MGNELQIIDNDIQELAFANGEQIGFATMRVCGQLFGISVLTVQDVLRSLKIAHVPLAPDVVAGSINLRGRIVTVIDMRKRLKQKPAEKGAKVIHVVVEYRDELYSLMVDSVGDVINLPSNRLEQPPSNLGESWHELSSSVCQLEKELLVVLDVQALLTFSS